MKGLALALAMLAGAVQADPAAEQAVADLRGARGGLAWSQELAALAAAHAEDMARRGVLSHEDAGGRGPGARAQAAGYCFRRISENVAQGYPDLGAVLAGWMGSQGHRRNILDRQVTEFGLARGPDNYWAMILARPC